MSRARVGQMSERYFYDLAGADPDLRFSPHCWKTRLALAHKRLPAESLPWRFTDREAIAFSGQERVPVLVDGGRTIADSWRIALYLEETYPDRPSLFGGGAGVPLAGFVNRWADTVLAPALARVLTPAIFRVIASRDQSYFRQSREARFGTTIEALDAAHAQHLAALAPLLAPLRLTLADTPFLSGDAPAYADYCVFGHFVWAYTISNPAIAPADDPVHQWRERMLSLFGGLAHNAVRAPSETVE